ncbi:MAG: superoxide dismutase [Ni] [Desulfurivibrionaceae bacterium]|nr:superoxide dismutase [Ni] [Desulfurivibrionaceae bacterium]
MKKYLLAAGVALVSLFFMATHSQAHCEIPCGIYDDEVRIQLILENITTIERSMQQIIEIEKKDPQQSNQLIRWVMNKEKHADKLQEIVSQYFLTQRLKPSAKKYSQQLTLLHQMLITAMKCKQSTDLSHGLELRDLTSQFKALYLDSK